MYKRYAWIALGAMAILATVLLFHASEEEQILERIEDLRTLAEIHSPEGGLEQIARAKQIAAFFRERSYFELTSAGYRDIDIPDRQELVRRIVRGRARLGALELAVQDPQVRIEGDRARVRLRGSALGSFRGEPGQFLEIHSVEVLFEKEAGEWLVAGAVHLRDERQPPP
ncbi:MAG: hypothetical protein PVJ15_03305 [Gammaproteobacteria bacterium]|jgi:hypothetical protein